MSSWYQSKQEMPHIIPFFTRFSRKFTLKFIGEDFGISCTSALSYPHSEFVFELGWNTNFSPLAFMNLDTLKKKTQYLFHHIIKSLSVQR